MKKIKLLILFCFLIAHSVQAQDSSPNSTINETTLALYCKNMFYAADLDDDSTLFWGHQGIDEFPAYLKDKTVLDIIETCPSSHSKKKAAFTAILNDRTLFCWGNEKYGGLLPKELVGMRVLSVASTKGAFAALLENGSVRAWGNEGYGGKIPSHLLRKTLPGHRVISLISTTQAFLALLEDGTICSWGDTYHGGKSPALTNVVAIMSNDFAFTALLKNGSVVSWCNLAANDYSTPSIKEDSVKTIVATDQIFSALLESGKIISWGFKANQIVSPLVQHGEHALSIAAHDNEFTAYLDSGRILLWNGYDRDSTSCEASTLVQQDSSPAILISDTAFAISPEKGNAFSWTSTMDNEGTHATTASLCSSKELIDIAAIPGGFSTLSKKNKVFSSTWTTNPNSTLENFDITPALPQRRILTSLYANFKNYETKTFPIVSPCNQVALIANPLSSQGQWEYFSKNGWLPIPLLPDAERPSGFILYGNTKVRFVPTAEFDPNNIPSLTIQRL